MKFNLNELYSERHKRTEATLKSVYAFENKKPAVYICEPNWWIFGRVPGTTPEDYCTGNIEAMLDYQINAYKHHLEKNRDDCLEAMLNPWYGTSVLPSAFGLKVSHVKDMDPAVMMDSSIGEHFVRNMKMPDPYKDGQMPLVLKTIDYFRENCDAAINLTDLQGPLSSALNIVGYENFIYWMYDEPQLVHELMDKVTDALIMWVKVQKKHMGVSDTEPAAMMHIRGLNGKGGIFFADDDEILLNADAYAEFAKPYNEKFLEAFGGGGIHCCGNVAHQVENLKNTKGLTIYHNCILGDFEHAAITQKGLSEKKIPYCATDFNPADGAIENYYDSLLDALSPEGLIIASYIAPATALINGKYQSIIRDADTVADNIEMILSKKINERY